LDGCCDHRVMIADEDLHRHAAETLAQADALLFGRVTYEMMEAGWRRAPAGARPDGMEPFGPTIDAAKKYVVSRGGDALRAETIRLPTGTRSASPRSKLDRPRKWTRRANPLEASTRAPRHPGGVPRAQAVFVRVEMQLAAPSTLKCHRPKSGAVR
jgi:hypothetical protein